MSLFLARTAGSDNFEFSDCELHITSIAQLDSGLGFNEASPTTIEGVTCVEVTYSPTLSGPTNTRLNALVHDTGFTSAQQIIVLAVLSDATFNGIPIKDIAGVALPIGATGSPFASHICTIYDAKECNGSGHWVDQEGGGTTSFPADVILYHELAHCFHFATGVTSTEPLAEIDENDMRDVRGIPHRETSSHNGGCGGGPVSCCIIASLATGSPYSSQVNRFRHLREHTLRHSKTGDAFFNEFFYRYYEFSPEITNLMGHQPKLGALIKDQFVMPLLSGVEMLTFYADHKGKNLAQFLHEHSIREGLTGIYQKSFLDELSSYLKLARNYDGKAISQIIKKTDPIYSGFKKLLQHIHQGTLNDEYMDWSLVTVVELWVESALLIHSDMTEAEMDAAVYDKICKWIALMPISNVWDELSRLETEIELQSLEQFIFDPDSKQTFSKRLIEKNSRHFETITRWADSEGRQHAKK